jgi:hypothetical protein
MTDQLTESQPVQPNSKTGFLQWLLVSLVLITALSLLAVHLPERLKLLLVYAVVYGLIAGGALTTLAVKFGVTINRNFILTLVCLILFGQSLVLYLSHQRYKEATLKQFKADQTSMVIDRMFSTGEPPEDPAARQEYEQVLKQFQAAKAERKETEQRLLQISSYLQHRISPVAKLKSPWPHLFWLVELILCCLAAIWASRQVTQSVSETSPPHDSSAAES